MHARHRSSASCTSSDLQPPVDEAASPTVPGAPGPDRGWSPSQFRVAAYDTTGAGVVGRALADSCAAVHRLDHDRVVHQPQPCRGSRSRAASRRSASTGRGATRTPGLAASWGVEGCLTPANSATASVGPRERRRPGPPVRAPRTGCRRQRGGVGAPRRTTGSPGAPRRSRSGKGTCTQPSPKWPSAHAMDPDSTSRASKARRYAPSRSGGAASPPPDCACRSRLRAARPAPSPGIRHRASRRRPLTIRTSSRRTPARRGAASASASVSPVTSANSQPDPRPHRVNDGEPQAEGARAGAPEGRAPRRRRRTRRVAQHREAAAGALDQPDRGPEDHAEGALAADQEPGQVAAPLGQQLLEAVAGHSGVERPSSRCGWWRGDRPPGIDSVGQVVSPPSVPAAVAGYIDRPPYSHSPGRRSRGAFVPMVPADRAAGCGWRGRARTTARARPPPSEVRLVPTSAVLASRSTRRTRFRCLEVSTTMPVPTAFPAIELPPAW